MWVTLKSRFEDIKSNRCNDLDFLFILESQRSEQASMAAAPEDKETTIEELGDNPKQSTITTTGNNNSSPNANRSVTSPIFNSMAVVSTSTPSSSDKETTAVAAGTSNSGGGAGGGQADVLNHTTNSIKQVESGATVTVAAHNKNINKIELSIQNSRPGTTSSISSETAASDNGSGRSTLRLFIKKQDFSVQVASSSSSSSSQQARDGPIISPNTNTLGRTKKSLDLISNEESRGI